MGKIRSSLHWKKNQEAVSLDSFCYGLKVPSPGCSPTTNPPSLVQGSIEVLVVTLQQHTIDIHRYEKSIWKIHDHLLDIKPYHPYLARIFHTVPIDMARKILTVGTNKISPIAIATWPTVESAYLGMRLSSDLTLKRQSFYGSIDSPTCNFGMFEFWMLKPGWYVEFHRFTNLQ